MNVAEAVARALEVLVFALFNGVVAAAIRGWFRWPHLREKTVATGAAGAYAVFPLIAAVLLRDALFMTLGLVVFCLNYLAILCRLRLTRPEPPR